MISCDASSSSQFGDETGNVRVARTSAQPHVLVVQFLDEVSQIVVALKLVGVRNHLHT